MYVMCTFRKYCKFIQFVKYIPVKIRVYMVCAVWFIAQGYTVLLIWHESICGNDIIISPLEAIHPLHIHMQHNWCSWFP